MELLQSLAPVLTIAGLFIWNRAESRADIRHMDNKLDAIRELTREIGKECNATIISIHEEIKDFHGRLCSLEEKNKK